MKRFNRKRRRLPAGKEFQRADIGNWIFLPEAVQTVIDRTTRLIQPSPGKMLGVDDRGELLFEAQTASFGAFITIEGFTGYRNKERIEWRK